MLKQNIFKEVRNSRMVLGETYFWTCTIKDWKELLTTEKSQQLIVNSLNELVKRKKVVIYAFVIMPNHIHLIWKLLEKNGKEMPHASFNKFTAHQLIKGLKTKDPTILKQFTVDEIDRTYRIWQRDPLAVLMDSREKIEQKIEYIHNNPLNDKWSLAQFPEAYPWSSAYFYETGNDNFGFLTHYKEEF